MSYSDFKKVSEVTVKFDIQVANERFMDILSLEILPRLFGIFLTDYFTDTPYEVELEKYLSLQQQFLDVVILRKNNGEFKGRFPDGLDNLKTYNLLSYKSKHESFDAWAVHELISYYVNYRKQVAEDFPDEAEFSQVGWALPTLLDY